MQKTLSQILTRRWREPDKGKLLVIKLINPVTKEAALNRTASDFIQTKTTKEVI
jgi:hypothetical protein